MLSVPYPLSLSSPPGMATSEWCTTAQLMTKHIAHDPQYTKLFVDIGSYINSIRDGSAATEPVSKRRKLDTPTSGASPAPTPPAVPKAALTTDGAVLTVEAISFTVPQRKKFSLLFTAKSVSAVTSTGTIEFGVEYDDIGS